MHCAKAAINGGVLNVRINCNDLDDKDFVEKIISKGNKILEKTNIEENKILAIVDEVLSS